MRTDLFDFALPADRIALRPASPRDSARLLVVKPGAPSLEDRGISDLPGLLRAGDCLVANDSKVIAARLHGRRIGRGSAEPAIEATLHKRVDGSHWRAFVKPAKKLETGDVVRFGTEGKVCFLGELDAQVSQKDEGGEIVLSFSFHGPILDQAIAERGEMPLPPYIASRREADEKDRTDYQTLFAQEEGSVAAPTAGLHFTEAVLATLRDRGVEIAAITLHVGYGTFQPVRVERVEDHRLETERFEIGESAADTINRALSEHRRVIGVGTTTTRTLEAVAIAHEGRLAAGAGTTDLLIYPGFRFRVIQGLITNFHLPRSSLLMLVSAFAGRDRVLNAYAEAIDQKYRFYSYGDAMLIS